MRLHFPGRLHPALAHPARGRALSERPSLGPLPSPAVLLPRDGRWGSKSKDTKLALLIVSQDLDRLPSPCDLLGLIGKLREAGAWCRRRGTGEALCCAGAARREGK